MLALLLAFMLAQTSQVTPLAQLQRPQSTNDPAPARLPDGKLQSEEILKAEHKKTLKEADDLVRLTTEVRKELDEHEHHVLSIGLLKKLEEIEKLSKKMRDRLKR